MAIDASIALQGKLPQFDNPLAQLAQVSQIQNFQNQNRLADLKFSEAERELSSDNALASLIAQGKTGDDVVRGLAAGGHGKNALAYGKTVQEQAKAKADLLKSQSELIDARLKQSRQFLDGVTTPEQYIAWHQGNHQDPVLGPALAARGVTAETALAGIQKALSKPGGFEELLNQSRLGIEKFAEANKPVIQTRNTGATTDTLAVNPWTGEAKVTGSVPNTQSPDSLASTASAAAARAVTMRGQDMTDARSREANALPRGQVVQTDQGTMLVDPRTGQAQPVMASGQPLQPKLKDLPAPIQKAYLENGSALGKIDRALAAVDEYPEAFGSKNMLGDAIRQRTDPKGVNGRALIADIGSLKIHDRSGAAVTAAETPRLKPFIPDVNDHPDTIKKKLALFQQEYKAIQDDIGATYTSEQGFRAPGGIDLTKVKPNTPEYGAVMADATRIGALRGQRKEAAAPAKPSLDDIFGKK